MKKRIFTTGADKDGNLLGEYKSETYLQRRLRKGKNNLNKNLYFDGNLFKSISVGKSGSKNVLGFTDRDEFEIAEFQEEQTGKVIFQNSDDEIKIMQDVLKEQTNRVIKECFQ